jgi:hypothetical protein
VRSLEARRHSQEGASPRTPESFLERRRIHGELILDQAGVDPAPDRTSQGWAIFLGKQAEAIVAVDFFKTVTLAGRVRRQQPPGIKPGQPCSRPVLAGQAAELGQRSTRLERSPRSGLGNDRLAVRVVVGTAR